MNKYAKEFKDFIAQGNFIDLAIAVLVGGAFAPVVNNFVNNVVLQFVALIFGKPNFDSVGFTIGDKVDADTGAVGTFIGIGSVITALINFLIIMLVAFLIVKAYNKIKQPPETASGPTEVELLTEIRDSLRARQ
jgi:large conductance mechanosensitive channel